MPIVPHRRRHLSSRSSHEQTNLFSIALLYEGVRQLWTDRVTREMAIYAIKSIRDLLLMGVELLTENTMIQVISSMKHDRTPLRDVAEEYFSDGNRGFIEFAYWGDSTYQVDTNSVLFLWVFYCFLHGPRGLKVLQKGVRCLTLARSLRVITFSLTILPNPNPLCNFTGPIDPWNLSPGGACNDLLYSGHVIVYTISALAVTILCASYPFAPLRLIIRLFIWIQLVQRMVRAVIELHHYSVDMFLGLCVTLLIWHAEILYCDLPSLPEPLYPHLKKLVFPYDTDGVIDGYADQVAFVYRRFKRQPMKTLINVMSKHEGFFPSQLHMKQV